MQWAMLVKVLLETLGPIAIDLISALVDGEEGAYERVKDIIPDPLKMEVKIAAEKARLKKLQGE